MDFNLHGVAQEFSDLYFVSCHLPIKSKRMLSYDIVFLLSKEIYEWTHEWTACYKKQDHNTIKVQLKECNKKLYKHEKVFF